MNTERDQRVIFELAVDCAHLMKVRFPHSTRLWGDPKDVVGNKLSFDPTADAETRLYNLSRHTIREYFPDKEKDLVKNGII